MMLCFVFKLRNKNFTRCLVRVHMLSSQFFNIIYNFIYCKFSILSQHGHFMFCFVFIPTVAKTIVGYIL